MSARSERLSRHSPAVFACAFVNLLLAELAAAGGLTWPARPLLAPTTLAAAHLTALGWLTLLMFGALFQFVPVISNRPLPSQRLVLAMLVLFEGGLWTLLAGFIGLAGPLGKLLPAGAILVLLAVALGIANLLPSLWRAARRSLPARCVLAGLGALIVTIALGVCFALALEVGRVAACLGPLLGGGLPAHLLAGLAGAAIETSGLALAGAGTALYLIDVARIYRSRRRRSIELHNRAAVAAFAILSLLLPLAILWQSGRVAAPLLVALALAGWLSGLALAQLYKIVAFLSWLVHFGGRLGTVAVPRVQDLISESRGVLGFGLFFGGVAVQGAGAALAAAGPFRIGTGLCLLGTLTLGREYWRAWNLRYTAGM